MFSPELKICSKKSLNQCEIFDQICQINREYSNKTNSFIDCGTIFKSLSYKNNSNQWTQDCSTPNKSYDEGSSSRKFRNIIAQKASKTPLQHIQNPLKAFALREENNSQRDGYSDYSDGDDIFFIEEYFKNSTFDTENTVYITKTKVTR